MDENIEVDISGYEEQRKEEILKTGEYGRVEIVVGMDNDPYISSDINDISEEQIAIMIISLEEVIKAYKGFSPEVVESLKKLRGTYAVDEYCLHHEVKEIDEEED